MDTEQGEGITGGASARRHLRYDPVRLGETIRRRRLGLSMTQEQLGDKMGYVHSRISQLENGRPVVNITWDFLVNMSKALGMSVEQFMEEAHMDRSMLALPDLARLTEQRQLLLADLDGVPDEDVALVRESAQRTLAAIEHGRRRREAANQPATATEETPDTR